MERFTRLAAWATHYSGHPVTAFGSILSVIIWAAAGPLVGFSTDWQLWANTVTTIVTFILVFLIQSAQNTDSAALHLKLDALIAATEGAHNAAMRADERTLGEIRVARQSLFDTTPD